MYNRRSNLIRLLVLCILLLTVGSIFARGGGAGSHAHTNRHDEARHAEERRTSEEKSKHGTLAENRENGQRREEEVKRELEKKYPEDKYIIIEEAYLRDSDGYIAKDAESPHEKRRVDFVVVEKESGLVVESVEVTSEKVDKKEQLAKEERIRSAGGNYVRDAEGKLYEIPDNVHTKVERRP